MLQEEVVAMADVKWQIPRKVEEKPVEVTEGEILEEIATTVRISCLTILH